MPAVRAALLAALHGHGVMHLGGRRSAWEIADHRPVRQVLPGSLRSGVASGTPVALLHWHVNGTARGVGQRVTDDRLQRSRTLVVRHNRERGASSPESDPEMAS